MKKNLDELDIINEQNEQLNEILDLLHELPSVALPTIFDSRLKQALKLERKKRKNLIWKRFSAVAAVFVVGFLSVFFLKEGNVIIPTGIPIESQKQESGKSIQQDEKNEIYGAYGALKEDENQKESDENQTLKSLVSDKTQVQMKEKTEAIARENEQIAESTAAEENAIFSKSNLAKSASEKPSRSFTYSGTIEEFNRCSETKITNLIEKINQQNTALIKSNNSSAASLEESIYEEITPAALKLYQDFFNKQQVTYKKMLKNSVLGERQDYKLQGNEKSTQVTITNLKDGIHISEPILDHADWLDQQLSNTTYLFQDYETIDEDSFIFHVTILVNENGEQVNEVRSIVWKPTE